MDLLVGYCLLFSIFTLATCAEDRISVKKCVEYEEYATESVSAINLAIDAHVVVENVRNCEFSIPLIIHGEPAKISEFPHMAAIGYLNTKTEMLEWGCGGSLISKRYVLTAAHCKNDGNGNQLNYVRLGAHNLYNETEEASPEDFHIEDFIVHPDYKLGVRYNDIALVRLDSYPFFSVNLRPACLWQDEDDNLPQAVATGWGITETGKPSQELMKVLLNITNIFSCSTKYTYSTYLPNSILESQMCAHSSSKVKQQDTCFGDSGGPLQTATTECMYKIIGVTSFGTENCGSKPGVYTKVATFLDWIENEVWGEEE